jgi:hypothetical protein
VALLAKVVGVFWAKTTNAASSGISTLAVKSKVTGLFKSAELISMRFLPITTLVSGSPTALLAVETRSIITRFK